MGIWRARRDGTGDRAGNRLSGENRKSEVGGGGSESGTSPRGDSSIPGVVRGEFVEGEGHTAAAATGGAGGREDGQTQEPKETFEDAGAVVGPGGKYQQQVNFVIGFPSAIHAGSP